MTDITIPPAALAAAARAIGAETYVGNQQTLRDAARAAITAALEAWPGMRERPFWDLMTNARHIEIILPPPQEASDA